MDKFWNIIRGNISNADVVLEVLDARNPPETRNRKLELIVQDESKFLILVLNKADLVPNDVVKQWNALLNKEFPSFYTSSTIKAQSGLNLLKKIINKRFFEREVLLLIVGYPNVGKSSLINAMFKGRKSVSVSPEAGHTRGVQYLKFSDILYIMDTPGVIPFMEQDEISLALKNALRVEQVKDILGVVERILELTPAETLREIYSIGPFTDAEDFLALVGRVQGKLKKDGIPDLDQVGKIVARDWQRNKIPYFVPPPTRNQA